MGDQGRMKLIEKLAKEHCGCDRHQLSDFEHTCESFEAGFRKAREMAKRESLTDLAGARVYPAGRSLVDVIEKLGEEEVSRQ